MTFVTRRPSPDIDPKKQWLFREIQQRGPKQQVHKIVRSTVHWMYALAFEISQEYGEQPSERAWDYIKDSRAANTRREYKADWNDLTVWCKSHS